MIVYIDYSIASTSDIKNRRRFSSTFNIEGIEIECLYEYISRKQKHFCSCTKPNRKIFRGAFE